LCFNMFSVVLFLTCILCRQLSTQSSGASIGVSHYDDDDYYYYYYGSTALCWALAAFFSFLILYIVGRTPWTGISPSQGLYLYTEEHKQNKHTQ
jgi:hypothetical protein